MADVFISYSRRDGAFVHELHASLTEAGRDVWVDWEDIPPTSKWQQDIDDSIDAAESFVFVLSPSSLASEYCGAELKHAEERGKRIVPIAIDGARPEDAPAELRELNWIWWRADDDAGAALAKLGSALDTDLDWSRAHTRLLVRAVEWNARRDGSLLLRGKDLAEAERALAANAGKDPRPTELQERYLHASRRAAARRQRAVLGGVTLALVVSAALGVLALLQRNDAREATRKATSAALAAAANDRVAARPDQALLLALDAYASSPSADARNAAVTALAKAGELGVSQFVHGDSEVGDIAFAPDGGTLAVGSADGAVRLWDLSARKEAVSLAHPGKAPIRSVGFTEDGSTVAAGSDGGTVRLWDVRSGELVAPVLRTGSGLRASAVSPDGRWAAAINSIGRVELWDVKSGSRRRLARPHGYQADWVLAFSPDSRLLGVPTVKESGGEGSVRVWDVASGTTLGDLPDMPVPEAIAFAPDGSTLATGSTPDFDPDHGELRIWSVPGLKERGRLANVRRFSDLAFGDDGRTVVTHGHDGSIREAARVDGGWRWTGPPRRHFPAEVANDAVFSPDGRTVAVAPLGATSVRVWTLDSLGTFGREVATKRGGAYGINQVIAFDPGGRTLAVADGDEVLVVPTGSATAEPYWLQGEYLSIFSRVAFGADGSTLAARDTDGAVRVWNLSDGRAQTSGAEAHDLDPAGRLLAAGGERAGVADVSFATASADGHTVAIADYAGNVWLWDSRSGEPAKKLALDPMGAPDGSVTALALSPDGRTLAVSDNGSLWLWDARAQRPLARLLPRTDGPPVEIRGLAFSPDGRALATDDGSVVQLWDGILWRDLAELRARVCSLVAGDLTREEWAAIAPAIAYRTTCDR